MYGVIYSESCSGNSSNLNCIDHNNNIIIIVCYNDNISCVHHQEETKKQVYYTYLIILLIVLSTCTYVEIIVLFLRMDPSDNVDIDLVKCRAYEVVKFSRQGVTMNENPAYGEIGSRVQF